MALFIPSSTSRDCVPWRSVPEVGEQRRGGEIEPLAGDLAQSVDTAAGRGFALGLLFVERRQVGVGLGRDVEIDRRREIQRVELGARQQPGAGLHEVGEAALRAAGGQHHVVDRDPIGGV